MTNKKRRCLPILTLIITTILLLIIFVSSVTTTLFNMRADQGTAAVYADTKELEITNTENTTEDLNRAIAETETSLNTQQTARDILEKKGFLQALQKPLELLGFNIDAPCKIRNLGISYLLSLDVNNLSIAVHEHIGYLRGFINISEEFGETKKTNEQKISRDSAIESVMAIMKALNLPYNIRSDEYIYRVDTNTWEVLHEPEYKGVKGAELIIFKISAANGQIIRFGHRPFIEPEPFVQHVSPEEAQTIANHYMVENSIKQYTIVGCEKRIVVPSNRLRKSDNPPGRLSWRITFAPPKQDADEMNKVFDEMINVDAETGHILQKTF